MKRLLLLFLLLTSHTFFGQCPSYNSGTSIVSSHYGLETLVFTTQNQIDQFIINYPTCTNLPYSVEIRGNDIVNLNGLANVTSISGNLVIGTSFAQMALLENLQGLQNLTSVGIQMVILNTRINDLSALESLASVKFLEINDNPFLTTLQGLEGITSLSKLKIIQNDALESLAGLENLGIVQHLPNTYPFILDKGTIEISSNIGLETLGLENLETVGFRLVIAGNPSLSSLGLGNITSAAILHVIGNNSLNNLQGLEDLNVSQAIDISANASLQNINSLQSVTMLPSGLSIFNNAALQNLSGLESLLFVGQNISIQKNSSLANIQALSALTNLGYPTTITISENNLLTNLQGMHNAYLAPVVNLQITLNPVLSICSTQNVCDYLDNGGIAVVNNNAEGCNSVAEIQSNCESIICPAGNLSFTSQASLDQFLLDYPSCTQISGNAFINGATVTSLAPLQNIASISGNLTIHFCANLVTLEQLENLTSVGGDVYLSTLINLPNFNGLQNLTQIGGSLTVVSNNSLTDLQGLEGISDINNTYIYIANNASLTSLNGLQNLNISAVSHLYLQDNISLSTCGIISNICEYLYNGGVATISGNTGECLNTTALLNSCPTIWNGTTWNLGEPNANRNAAIQGNLTLVADLTTKNLTVNSGTLAIPDSINLTVNGKIANNLTAANFVLASGSNLVQTSDLANEGAITVNRNSFPLYRQDYTAWCSPVSGQNLRGFSPQTLFSRFYSYNTSAGIEGEYAQELFTNTDIQNKVFENAKGYLIRMPNDWPEFVNQLTPGTSFSGKFIGNPNNGNISINLSTSNTGANLVGNPYPSAISISAFFDGNPGIERTLYFWRKRNAVNSNGYATYTELGLASLQLEADGLDLQNSVNPGQGFFVKSTGQTTLNFTNLMRSSAQNGIFLRNENTVEKHRIWLNLSTQENVISQTLLGYTQGATQGIDSGLDGSYFNDGATALTSLIGNQEFAIQARSVPFNDYDSVALGFKTDSIGNYKISLFKFDGLFESDQQIFLKDNSSGQLHDLKASDYSFISNAGTFNERFEIVYQSTLTVKNPEFDASKIMLYKNNGQLHIDTGSITMQKIELIDPRGRLISTLNGINASVTKINTANLANQMMLVRITSSENMIVVKKVIL